MIWLIGICLAISIINLFLLIAIAGTISKVVLYLSQENTREARMSGDASLYREVDGQLVQIGPTYDQGVLRGNSESFSDGVTRRPSTKNWDGVTPRQ